MKQSKTVILIIGLITSALLLTSCDEANPQANWVLTSISDGKESLSVEDNTLPVITMFIDKEEESYKVSGFSGVNNFTGTITLDGNKLEVSPLAGTLMMGPEKEQKAEDLFLKTLQAGGQISEKEIDGKTVLILKNNKNKTTAKFTKTLLENTNWTLSMYNVGNAVTNLPDEVSNVTMGFSTNGKIFGHTGSNQIMGSYTSTKEGSLSLSDMGMTRMAAMNEEARAFEVKLVELLSQVTSYQLSGPSLSLRNDKDELLLVYTR